MTSLFIPPKSTMALFPSTSKTSPGIARQIFGSLHQIKLGRIQSIIYQLCLSTCKDIWEEGLWILNFSSATIVGVPELTETGVGVDFRFIFARNR